MDFRHKTLVGLTVERETEYPHPSMEGLRLRAYPTGRKVWLYQRMVAKKRVKKTLGRFPAMSIVEALVAAQELTDRLERGEEIKPPKPAPEKKRMTVREGWERYEANFRAKRLACADQRVREAKDFLDACGEQNLRDVTVDELEEAISRPLARNSAFKGRGNTGGAAARNRGLSIARMFFKFCLLRGYDDLRLNPALAIDMLEVVEGSRPKRPLTLREMALLVLAGRAFDQERAQTGEATNWADIVTLLAFNGNRISEVVHAKRSQWNPRERVWHILPQDYKTKAHCWIPVGPTSAAIFDRLCQSKGTSPFLFPSQTGVRTGQYAHVIKRLNELMIEIGGEPIERWLAHDIRSGFCSNLRKCRIADSATANRIIHPLRKIDPVNYDPNFVDEITAALAGWDALLMAEVDELSRPSFSLVA